MVEVGREVVFVCVCMSLGTQYIGINYYSERHKGYVSHMCLTDSKSSSH